MTAAPFPFTSRGGISEFVCQDCGVTVISYGDNDRDFPVCRTCMFISEHPQLTDEMRAVLRGER